MTEDRESITLVIEEIIRNGILLEKELFIIAEDIIDALTERGISLRSDKEEEGNNPQGCC